MVLRRRSVGRIQQVTLHTQHMSRRPAGGRAQDASGTVCAEPALTPLWSLSLGPSPPALVSACPACGSWPLFLTVKSVYFFPPRLVLPGRAVVMGTYRGCLGLGEEGVVD